MNAWQELVKMALLGTEKMPLQIAALPHNIQNLLVKADTQDKEAHFLKAAALTLTYWKAGRQLDNTALPEIPFAEEETQVFAPPQYLAVFKTLFEKSANKRTDLYVLLFEKMKQKGYVVPHENLFKVMSLLEISEFKHKKTSISDIIGVRGHWLQQFNSKWTIETIQNTDTLWQEGSSSERRMALSKMRQDNPNKAFEWINQTWANENVRDRKEFLKVLDIHSQPEEWIFVQAVYNELLDAKATTKAVNQEIKEIAATILLQNPASDLFKSVVGKLQKYVSVKKTLLGLKSNTILTIPTEEDDFLNKEVMKTDFALTNTPSTNELLTEYWFCYFLQNLHPTAWETLLNTDNWDTILNILKESDDNINGKRKKQRYSFHKYLAMILGKTKYRKGIEVYFEKDKLSDFDASIFAVLTNEELEKFYIKKLDAQNSSEYRHVLIRANWQWSSALSLQILRGLVNDTQGIHYNAQFAENVAIHFDDSILKELHELSNQEQTDWQKQQLQNTIIQPLILFLEIRKEIENL
jgi:Family of unknown function (DUF5691)